MGESANGGTSLSVWICVPSKRPVEVVAEWAAAWRERGYKVALWRDYDPTEEESLYVENQADYVRIEHAEYPGYAVAVNTLVAQVLHDDPDCNWIVTGGDDVYPDLNHTADEIARECGDHFSWAHQQRAADPLRPTRLQTFGVMQPTGDRFPSDTDCWADRVCCSPWMGREFCLRINQGRGPLWPEYTHNFVDEELQNVALKYGVLWQRRDLVQRHENWSRARRQAADMPEFLRNVSGRSPEARAHWVKYKALFESRKAASFPGSELL